MHWQSISFFVQQLVKGGIKYDVNLHSCLSPVTFQGFSRLESYYACPLTIQSTEVRDAASCLGWQDLERQKSCKCNGVKCNVEFKVTY